MQPNEFNENARSWRASNNARTDDETRLRPSAAISADLLIIGAGPAGASLACFLSSYGMTCIVVSAASCTSNTPRAHITNMAALECLRDIGIEVECCKVASDGLDMMHTRWCHSMAGEEYARVYSWANHPQRKGDYELASSCKPVDLPQTLLEPTLMRYASHHGFQFRFDTSFVSFEEGCNYAAGRHLWHTVSSTVKVPFWR